MLCSTFYGEGNGTHSSTLAWKIPWMKEPGRLQSMGSLGVGHGWATSLSLFTFIHWRRKWQPTPVFLPRESQGRGSLVGCGLWGCRVGHDWSDLAAAVAAALSKTVLCQPIKSWVVNLKPMGAGQGRGLGQVTVNEVAVGCGCFWMNGLATFHLSLTY